MLLLLLLPSLALASINVSLKGTIYNENNKFNIVGIGNQKGFDQQIVNNDDLPTLNINNEQLKSMIEKVHGKKPDEVLVRNDVKWGEIYKKQNWNQVQRKIESNIDDYYLDFKQEKVVLTNTTYENSNSKRKNVLVRESQTVNNYVMSIWTRPMVKGKNVNVKFEFELEEYDADFQKEFVIGEDRRYVVHEYFVQNHTIDLQPKQTVKARLEATKGTITAVIPYKVKLSGDVVAKYNSMYKNKYFFNFDIKQLLEANQKSATITVHQTVLFEFHYDVKLHIIGANEIVLRSFSEEHASGKGDTGKRKASAKKEYESADGVKLGKKSIPAEFIKRIHEAVVEETVEVNEESGETA